MADDPLTPGQGSTEVPAALPSGRFPVVIIAVGASFMVWLVAFGQGGDSHLASWMVLRSDDVRPQAMLLHVFFYRHPLHMALSLAALFFAGRLLELRWGSPCFGIYFVFVSVFTAGVTLCLHWLMTLRTEPSQPVLLFGGASVVLSSLAVVSLLEADRPILGVFPRRYLFWCLVLLGSTGLLLVDGLEAPLPGTRVFLLPQVSGILFGWMFHNLIPVATRLQVRWELQRRLAEEEKLKKMRHRVNQLLDKINRHGMQSLSTEEHAFLKQASKHYRRGKV